MNSKKITFKNNQGLELSARLELPATGSAYIYAIFAHCFTCSKDLVAVRNISRSLTASNIGVLRFDFTGLGESEGEFSDTNFSSNIEDLISAHHYLKDNYKEPRVMIGHSLGGAAVIAAASQLKALGAVVTIGSPADPTHVQHMFDKDFEEITTKGEATVDIGGRPFQVKSQLIEDLKERNTKAILKNLEKALLIFHSPQDQIVGIDNAREIYEGAMHPKSFISLDGADHLLSNKQDSMYVGQMIAAWVTRYVELSEDEKLATERQVVARTGDDGYTTQIKAGDHSFLADEPESVGGKNLGPTPYDLLIASLGACTGMTLRMYADRKKWPLEEVNVHLQHNKVHKEDCDTCDEGEAKIDRIDREIVIHGDLTQEQRSRLLEIADKCPVHKTLHGKIKVNTNLLD